MIQRNWSLLNAALLQKKYPGRYLRPASRQLLGLLTEGNLVQLILKVSRNKPRRSIGIEFIWVEVIGYRGGVYYGKMINSSGIVKELEIGMKVMFIPEQVLLCKEKEVCKPIVTIRRGA